MAKITITEALSELNLIKKKIAKKKPDIEGNLVRYDHMADTFEKQGGSEKFISGEIQAVDDLRKRFVAIRSAIAKVNTETSITIGQKTMTINEWLNWRRDQAQDDRDFHFGVAQKVKHHLDQQAQRPAVYKDEKSQETKVAKLIPNTQYADHLKRVEEIDEMMENLDGQLSLKNATVTIEI